MREFELIARVRERLREAGAAGGERVLVGSGDDAAVTVAPGTVVTTVDAVVEGVHFRADAPPRSVGRKALAVALSDLAAMGAEPGEAYVVLGVPDVIDDDRSLEVCEGFISGARDWRVAVLGGDVTRSPVLFLAVTAIGYADSPQRLVRRAGAEPGHAVAVTGELGGAAAGLLLQERPELAAGIGLQLAESLRARQLEPEPRIGAGRALAGAGAAAMIDLSDGLGGDAGHLASAGGVAIEIESAGLPIQPGVTEVARAAGLDPLALVAGGGEDYELLVCVPADRLADARRRLASEGTTLTVIGEAREGSGVILLDPGGGRREAAGFEHFRAAADSPT